MFMDRRTFLSVAAHAGLVALVDAALPGMALATGSRDRHDGARPPSHHRQNVFDDNILTVYYLTNSWALYDNDLADITAFHRAHRDSGSVIIEGHCDARGDDYANLELGERRARGVGDRLHAIGYRGATSVVSYGENRPATEGTDREALQQNRRVLIAAGETLISRGLDRLPGDAYLIDATGSMTGDKWSTVQQYRYPPQATVYAFNDCIGLEDITSVRDVTPSCGTPLWDSLGALLDRTGSGRRLTVLSDGGDNSSERYTPRQIIDAAIPKHVPVSTLGIGPDGATNTALIQIARETGGQFYVAR